MNQTGQLKRSQFTIVNFMELSIAAALICSVAEWFDAKNRILVFSSVYALKLLITLFGERRRALGVIAYIAAWSGCTAIGIRFAAWDETFKYFIGALWFATIPTVTFTADMLFRAMIRPRILIWRTLVEVLLLTFVWVPCWSERLEPFLRKLGF